MGNHEIPCDYCGEDKRGLSGVSGCNTQEQADHCSNYTRKKEKITIDVRRVYQINEVTTWIETFRHSGKVERTHTVPTIQRYNNAEHVCNAMMIAIELCRMAGIGSSRVIKSLLVHDVEEVYTGDFPANIKHHENLKEVLSRIEKEWAEENVPKHHNNIKLTDTQYKIAKIADSLELVYFCIDEALMGNRTKPLINMIYRVSDILIEKTKQLDNKDIAAFSKTTLNQLKEIVKDEL